jgi:hypothetical protein
MLKRYDGRHSGIFVSLFIIFQHWARHDAHKERADRALWDPDHDDKGFDTFYPLHVKNTELKPWMFSVTQALRDWICDLVDKTNASSDYDRARVTITPEGEHDVQYAEIDSVIDDLVDSEMKEINMLFEKNIGEVHGFKLHGHRGDETGDIVTPIMAALDWEKGEIYDNLTERGMKILSSAFRMAFPTGGTFNNPDDVTGCDIGSIDKFKAYIKAEISKICSAEPLSLEFVPSLSSITIKSMVGVKVETDSPAYHAIKNIPHIPVLFPSMLVRGDVLAIYDKKGCTIAKFIHYYSPEKFDEEILAVEKAKMRGNPELEKRAKKNHFMPMFRAICYSLDQTDPAADGERMPSRLFIHNFTDIYILSIKKRTI